jgi:precorrin-6B methylase 2
MINLTQQTAIDSSKNMLQLRKRNVSKVTIKTSGSKNAGASDSVTLLPPTVSSIFI